MQLIEIFDIMLYGFMFAIWTKKDLFNFGIKLIFLAGLVVHIIEAVK